MDWLHDKPRWCHFIKIKNVSAQILVSPAVQQKDAPPVNAAAGSSTSSLAVDFLTPPASADVAADIAKYTTKVNQMTTEELMLGPMRKLYCGRLKKKGRVAKYFQKL